MCLCLGKKQPTFRIAHVAPPYLSMCTTLWCQRGIEGCQQFIIIHHYKGVQGITWQSNSAQKCGTCKNRHKNLILEPIGHA